MEVQVCSFLGFWILFIFGGAAESNVFCQAIDKRRKRQHNGKPECINPSLLDRVSLRFVRNQTTVGGAPAPQLMGVVNIRRRFDRWH